MSTTYWAFEVLRKSEQMPLKQIYKFSLLKKLHLMQLLVTIYDKSLIEIYVILFVGYIWTGEDWQSLS